MVEIDALGDECRPVRVLSIQDRLHGGQVRQFMEDRAGRTPPIDDVEHPGVDMRLTGMVLRIYEADLRDGNPLAPACPGHERDYLLVRQV